MQCILARILRAVLNQCRDLYIVVNIDKLVEAEQLHQRLARWLSAPLSRALEAVGAGHVLHSEPTHFSNLKAAPLLCKLPCFLSALVRVQVYL